MSTGTVAYVLCSTRSGSTWLALMLGSNERASYVGELARMFRTDPEGCSLCMERGQGCPVFHDIASLKPRDAHAELLSRTGSDVLIDNSKSLSWLRKTWGASVDKKAIHLLRDPRAVVYSWQQRGRPKGLEQWIEENEEISRTLEERAAQLMVVTYNALADATDDTMRELSTWLSLDYAPEQQSYWETEHHGAGRNGATASFLQDYVASDEAFYAAHRRQHFHDLRWQEGLDPATREGIEQSRGLATFLDRYGLKLSERGLAPVG